MTEQEFELRLYMMGVKWAKSGYALYFASKTDGTLRYARMFDAYGYGGTRAHWMEKIVLPCIIKDLSSWEV